MRQLEMCCVIEIEIQLHIRLVLNTVLNEFELFEVIFCKSLLPKTHFEKASSFKEWDETSFTRYSKVILLL